MSAIVLDASKVNSYVLPSLVKSKNTMQDAYSTSVSLKNSLPSSFRYKNLVNDIVNQIYKSKKEINDVNSIISKKIDSAKNIESKSDNRASKISSMVSKIGAVSGTIGGAAIGNATGGVVGAVVGGVVGSKVGKTIADTGAKVASKVVSGVKKLGTSIVDGFKWVGSKITSAYKSATNWISDKANKVSDWVSEKFEAAKTWTSQALKDTGAFISKIGTTIWSGLKTAWTWATDIENWKKVGASIVNGVIALVKGLVSLVEAIGDFVVLLGAVSSTINTAKIDIVKGVVTGNWDFSTTKKLWDNTKSVVAYNWTNKIFDSLYNSKLGQTLDEYAYSPFKSDGMGCKIIEGIGYVAGVIVLTIATFGVGGVATAAGTTVSTTTAMAMTATASGIGKYTSEEWNKNSISINYGGTDVDFAIDYEKYSEIEKLKQGESTTISQQITLEDGSIQEFILNITSKGNGEYLITDKDGNVANLNSLNESSTAKGLAIGGLKGVWEGAQWYVGGKIGAGEFTKITGKIASPVVKKIATSGIRVGLDTATGVVEVPFQSLVAMMSEGKSWNEAWQSQGGWDAVKMQAGIAGISSFAGEAFDLSKILRNNNKSKNTLAQNIELEDELAFFDSDRIFNRKKYAVKTEIDLNLTATQRQTVDQINNFIRNGQSCVVTYNSTSEISSMMLDQIDDLSKVEIKLLDGLGDSNGSLKSKYLGSQKYDARITYQGYEMKAILERIENLQSKVDMSLPVEQRAKQIYEILSEEVPVMRDFGSYQYGHHVSASLRGLIPDNLVGKEGLVCAGYASVYKELCDRTGIRCDYVRGKAVVDPLRGGIGGGHAWNVVYTDNGMIPVDVTWKASNGKEWFGGSDDFVQTHIADADEISRNYEGMIPSVMFESSSDKLNKVLSILDNKYGSRQESIKRLQGYLDQQNISIITRTDGAREIISTIDDQTIRNFISELDINKKLSDVVYIMDQKVGSGYGIRALKEYLTTGNSNLITRTDGARDFICSLNLEDIQEYLRTLRG